MSGVWGGTPPESVGGGPRFIGQYGGVRVVVDPEYTGSPKLVNRVVMDDYFIEHDTWGSAVLMPHG